jgi:phosphohistidine phosphatase SixA
MTLMRRGWFRVSVIVALILVALTAVAPPGVRGQPQEGMTADLLRQGGYIIFFRHTTSDVGSDASTVNVADCDTQRNMSEVGLREARTIGQGFRALGIPVGAVLSSEFCRALETARVAFGTAQMELGLNFCCADQRPMTQDQRFAWLEGALATPPAAGTNTVLVGHGVGIMVDLAMGEAAIYRPDGGGGFVRVARVLPAEWITGVYPPGGMR